MSGQHLGAPGGLGVVAVHGRAHGDEMQVVAVVHHGVEALRPAGLDVGAIGRRRHLVGLDRRRVVSGANVNMGRHMHQVSRGQRHRGQAVRRSQCSLRRCRCLDRMNVVMDCAHVVGIALDHRLQRGHDFFGAGCRAPVQMPQTPRVQIHAGLREQGGRIQIVGKVLDHFAHGIVIGLSSLPAVGFGIGRKSQRHGMDVGLLGGRSIG